MLARSHPETHLRERTKYRLGRAEVKEAVTDVRFNNLLVSTETQYSLERRRRSNSLYHLALSEQRGGTRIGPQDDFVASPSNGHQIPDRTLAPHLGKFSLVSTFATRKAKLARQFEE
jgi:hypothetical protein